MAAPSKASPRKFGLVVGAAFALFGTLSWARGHIVAPRVLWGMAGLLIGPAVVAPAVLGPVERVWMRAAAILGQVNSRIILTLLFYVVIAPIGLLMRCFRDPLDRELRDERASCWIKRPPQPVDPKRYEQQF